MPNREDTFERIQRLFPRTQDLTLIVLKGQLLLEEKLQHFLEDLSRKPEALTDARLTFFQRWRLVQAITGYSRRDHVAKFVKGVNSLRNKLAHRAEVPEVEAAVDLLLEYFYESEFVKPTTRRQRAKELRNAFIFTIAMVSGYAEGYVESMKYLTERRETARSNSA